MCFNTADYPCLCSVDDVDFDDGRELCEGCDELFPPEEMGDDLDVETDATVRVCSGCATKTKEVRQ